MRSILLAGGRATRLGPLAKTRPKCLMEIDGRPLLDILLAQLSRAGFDFATLCVGHLEDAIRHHINNGCTADMSIDCVSDGGTLGTAGPLRLVSDWNEPALVINGDLITDLDFGGMASKHRQDGACMTLAVGTETVQYDKGVVTCNGRGRVSTVIEKPKTHLQRLLGAYVVDPGIRRYLPASRKDMPELINAVINDGGRVGTFQHCGLWHDIGTPHGLQEARESVRANRAAFGIPEEPGQ